MKSAIAILEIALETVTTNEPINRARGNVEQADNEARNAEDYRAAIGILTNEAQKPTRPKSAPSELTRDELIANGAEAHALLHDTRAKLEAEIIAHRALQGDNEKCRAAVDGQTERLLSAREALGEIKKRLKQQVDTGISTHVEEKCFAVATAALTA